MIKQRQNSKLFNSYKRLNNGKDSGSDSGEETELLGRNKAHRKEIPTIEKNIEDGDTLQSLAIRYHCTISDLKRLNNIDKENEIFAKRLIKVPFRPFSMALAGVHISGRSSPDASNQPSTSNLIDIDSLSSKLTDNFNIQNGKKDDLNNIIFNSQIMQKPCDRLSEDIIDESSEEVCLLPQRERELLQAETIVSALNCSGADADISWIGLIVCIVIVIFAIPLIYVFYIAEHPDKYHNHIS